MVIYWTKKEEADLLKWRSEGKKWSEIAKLLGGERSVNAVRRKFQNLEMGKKLGGLTTDELSELFNLRKDRDKFEDLKRLLSQNGSCELYQIPRLVDESHRETVPILQISDNHVDEIVSPESVMGMNEYNPDIAQKRSDILYAKAAKLIYHHQSHYNINQVVIAYEGDAIGNWIHPELEQTNSIPPLEAIYKFKSMAVSGLKYLHDNLDVEKITVVMVCGNHPRTTKKVQYSNFTDVNLEYYMYLDIAKICKDMGLNKFEFIIPKNEMVVLEILGKRMLFAHGHQFKYAGGIGGIYPSMLRWYAKMAKTFKIDKAFIGHWHTSININEVTVNGTAKGWDAYAMSHGFEFERPCQNMTLLDSKYGFCLFQPIFLDA